MTPMQKDISHIKKRSLNNAGLVMHTCNPSSQEAETGGLGV
jgi:hypothetical protein